jgi:hypothetical protein
MSAWNKYLDVLAETMQHDAAVLNDPWMYTGVLLMLYVIYAAFKWYILLAPLTLPLTVWGIFRSAEADLKKRKQHAKTNHTTE